VLADPIGGGQVAHQGTIQAAWVMPVDVLQASIAAQFGIV
jgi:hypothetical protein